MLRGIRIREKEEKEERDKNGQQVRGGEVAGSGYQGLERRIGFFERLILLGGRISGKLLSAIRSLQRL